MRASASSTKNSEYGKRRRRARRTFLWTVGNCRGLSRIRSISAPIALRKCRPNPASSSYQFCASINSARAACVKNRIHYGQRRSSSAFRAVQVTPVRLSSSSETSLRSSSDSCERVNGRCSCSRLSQSCAIRAKRSGAVRRTISSGVGTSMPSSLREKRHGGKATENRAGGTAYPTWNQRGEILNWRPAQHHTGFNAPVLNANGGVAGRFPLRLGEYG